MNTNIRTEAFSYYRDGALQIIGSHQTDAQCERPETDWQSEQQQTSPCTSASNKTLISPHQHKGCIHDTDVGAKISYTNKSHGMPSDVLPSPACTGGQCVETFPIAMTEWNTS